MPSLLPFNKITEDRNQQQNSQQAIEEEAKSFHLADPRWLLIVAKIAALGICTILNWNFWTRVIPGAFGTIIASLAIVLEVMAFVCWNSISKSAGKFRVALIAVAIYLTLLSIAHASLEYWRETDLIRAASKQIQDYANYYSLGVMICSIIGCAFALQLCHWRNKVNQERAKADENMQIGRARLIGERSKMQQENELDNAKLAHMDEQLQIQMKAVDKIKEIAAVHQAAEAAINSIPDETLRANVRRQFGEVAVIGSGDSPKP